MSERGSFVTEYIYCDNCLETLREHFLPKQEKEFSAYQIQRIIAGRLGALYAGGELEQMVKMQDKVKDKLCHPVRVSILCDDPNHDLTFDLKNGNVYEPLK